MESTPLYCRYPPDTLLCSPQGHGPISLLIDELPTHHRPQYVKACVKGSDMEDEDSGQSEAAVPDLACT